MKNRIHEKLQQDSKLLSIYFTAGYPNINDTVPILEALQQNGVDLVEIGLPFSDPLADGPTIQASSTHALKNGMTTQLLFQQLEGVRKKIDIPLIIMGYFNPILQYGVEQFCARCAQVGIDGLIIPDLPIQEYQLHYEATFKKYGLSIIFLITPQTSNERIRVIDDASDSFIYMVSSASTTGSTTNFGSNQAKYFKRISEMNLNCQTIVGFGISDKQTFTTATQYSKGAIIGSAFIKVLAKEGLAGIAPFIEGIRKV